MQSKYRTALTPVPFQWLLSISLKAQGVLTSPSRLRDHGILTCVRQRRIARFGMENHRKADFSIFWVQDFHFFKCRIAISWAQNSPFSECRILGGLSFRLPLQFLSSKCAFYHISASDQKRWISTFSKGYAFSVRRILRTVFEGKFAFSERRISIFECRIAIF